eukprot:gene7953-16282_t
MDFGPLLKAQARKKESVKDQDIDSFLDKVNAVDDAIKGMIDGTIDPATVKIEGIETEDEKNEREALELKRKEERKALRAERRKEEKERWWSGVKAFKSLGGDVDVKGNMISASTEVDRNTQRYSSNYARWEEYKPDDPVSIQEEKERIEAEDRIKNAQFENQNKQFCDAILFDFDERDKINQKKEKSTEVLRVQGNKLFKEKKYDDAIDKYMEGLKIRMYDTRILLNIAQ